MIFKKRHLKKRVRDLPTRDNYGDHDHPICDECREVLRLLRESTLREIQR